MSAAASRTAIRWYQSLYWRIAVTFVLFVFAVLLVHGSMLRYFADPPRGPLADRTPNNRAAILAADVGAALQQNPDLDLQQYLAREYAGMAFPVFLIMRDGRVATNSRDPLAEDLRRSAEALLTATDFRKTGREPDIQAAVVMAPIQVDQVLRGMVVLPPAARGASPLRGFGPLFSVSGTTVLMLATTIAAMFIFRPARRRLSALQEATERLGAGDVSARAPEEGTDEIAHVARSFNMMAAELAARDTALRTSDRLRRQMLADVSHELKTPLTAMRGYLETLRMSEARLDPATRQRYFETVETETLRLDRIVKDLLDLARLESGVSDLQVRPFAIARLFEHVIRRHEHDAREAQVRVVMDVTDEADQIVADPDRIEQVIENLVANALQHAPAGGRIMLQATVEGHAAVLSVSDSGPGIATEHIPQVFERFYKIDAARVRGSRGSGLGLSITRAIVERHRGAIEVKSIPGNTVFRIVLPQAAAV